MTGMAPAPETGGFTGVTWLWLGLLGGLWAGYLGLRVSPRCRATWPWSRSLLWTAGLLAAGSAVVGPLADRATTDFRWRVAGHLALGMVAPLGLMLAAPITLVLRAPPPDTARWLVHRLERRGPRLLIHPLTAALLNVGGLWLIFTTRLFPLMHRQSWLGALVELHMLLAGCLFTAAIIGIDPVRGRPSRRTRAVVLVLALAAHAILAKYLYAHPPAGVSLAQARAGALLMYYGGDVVDAILIALFCGQWFRATRPATVTAAATARAASRTRD